MRKPISRRTAHDQCPIDTVAKITPYLMALGHYHEIHSGHVGSYTGLVAGPDMQDYPDVYIVTDPKTRALFQELTARIRAGESKAVEELRRMMKLTGPGEPAGPEPRPAKRRAAAK